MRILGVGRLPETPRPALTSRIYTVFRLSAVAAHRLPGGIRVGAIFDASLRVGRAMRQRRQPAVVPALTGAPVGD